MKTELKAKLLQHLTKKNQNNNAGFTLIELLVVIIIIGILSAIALPSFLNQAAKARGAEAKSNVGAMNRAQQAYFLEQQKFTPNVAQLGLSMKNTTENFAYTAETNGQLEPTSSDATAGVTNLATSQKPDIKGYAGGTFYSTGATQTILCEADGPGVAKVAAPTSATKAVADDPATPDVDESVPAGINCGKKSTQVK